MRYLDLPPLWLMLFIALAWGQQHMWPLGAGGLASHWAGGALIALGLVLAILAVLQFLQHKTSVIPGATPRAMITGGVYRLSRNPIYLADTLILAGACLWMGAGGGLVFVPAFMWLIQKRFIIPEERRLQAAFGPDFARYRAQVRRWV